ncbi:hypothetical protein PI124_g17077 [Phytophthora idaei]|nr:hypothetical protein PI125_g15068 [Phytophthora idaei]KAG3137591.1 hypothetical protein PI126_g17322 [Phytophthora idaei]KAG3237949.1 hypothetical protein PI124_g17077 [Phytophthora idaei]
MTHKTTTYNSQFPRLCKDSYNSSDASRSPRRISFSINSTWMPRKASTNNLVLHIGFLTTNTHRIAIQTIDV